MSSKYVKPAKVAKIKKADNPIPKDLSDMWSAVEAASTAFNVMKSGAYQHGYLTVLNASLAFLAKLHEQMMEEVLKHPQCDLLTGVQEYKKSLKEKEGQDGKIQEAAAQ